MIQKPTYCELLKLHLDSKKELPYLEKKDTWTYGEYNTVYFALSEIVNDRYKLPLKALERLAFDNRTPDDFAKQMQADLVKIRSNQPNLDKPNS